MSSLPRFVALASLLALVPGCTEEPDDDEGGIVVFDLRGTVRAFGSGNPVAGVELCPTELEGYDCATSGDDGRFTILFPQGKDSYLTATHPDYPRHLMHVRPVGGQPYEPRMLSQAQLEAAADAAGATLDPARGHLLIVAGNTEMRLNGVTASISSGVGFGPVYYNGLYDPDPMLPATTGAGAVLLGNIGTGVATAFADHPELECAVPSRSRDGDGVPFLFEAGTVSVSDEWACIPPAPPEGETGTTG